MTSPNTQDKNAAEIAATQMNAEDVVVLVNAVLVAKEHDPVRTAIGLITIAEMLVEDDFFARNALAILMRESADKLHVEIN